MLLCLAVDFVQRRDDGRYSEDYVDCVGNVVKSFCSIAAETWQRKFVSKSLCPLLVSQGCLGWDTHCSEFCFHRPVESIQH